MDGIDEGNKRKGRSASTQEIEGKVGEQTRRKEKERRDSQGRDGHTVCHAVCIGAAQDGRVGYVCMYVRCGGMTQWGIGG